MKMLKLCPCATEKQCVGGGTQSCKWTIKTKCTLCQVIACAVTFGAKWVFICRFWKAYKLGSTLVTLSQHQASVVTNIRKLMWLEINQCVSSLLLIYPIVTNLGHICRNVLNTQKLNLSMTHTRAIKQLYQHLGLWKKSTGSVYNKWLS